jgi:DNA polymerase III sliding clamp (beta) subunit (PCNA family)
MQHAPIQAATPAPAALTIDRADLLKALVPLNTVIEARNTIPILSNVMIEARADGGARLSGTDLDLQLAFIVPADIEMPGAFTVGAASLLSIVKGLDEGARVRMIVDNGRVMVSAGRAALALPLLPVDDFPVIAAGDLACSFEVDAQSWADDLGRLRHAISTEITRYYLNGVFMGASCEAPAARREEHEAACDRLALLKADLQSMIDDYADIDVSESLAETGGDDVAALKAAIREQEALCAAYEAKRCKPDTLAMVATDGHRMARVRRPLPALIAFGTDADGQPLPAPVSFADAIIPRKCVALIVKLLGAKPKRGEYKGAVSVSLSRSKIRVVHGDMVITSKLIDGTFPDYTRVIPSVVEHVVKAAPAGLHDAVKRVTAIASDRTRSVAVEIGHDRLTLSCTSPENGVAREEQPADAAEAAAMTIGFNAAYLCQLLALGGKADTVAIGVNAPDCPAHITFPALPECDFVLMPMRIDGKSVSANNVRAGAIRTLSAAEQFKADFGRGWQDRCKATMDAACAAYRAAIVPDDEGHALRLTGAILSMASMIKGDVRSRVRRAWTGRYGHPVRPSRPGNPARPLQHLGWAETDARLHRDWLSTLPGFHADDPRALLPVDIVNWRGRAFVLASDIAQGYRHFYTRDAKGLLAVAGRGGHHVQPVLWNRIVAVKPGVNRTERKMIAEAIAAAAAARIVMPVEQPIAIEASPVAQIVDPVAPDAMIDAPLADAPAPDDRMSALELRIAVIEASLASRDAAPVEPAPAPDILPPMPAWPGASAFDVHKAGRDENRRAGRLRIVRRYLAMRSQRDLDRQGIESQRVIWARHIDDLKHKLDSSLEEAQYQKGKKELYRDQLKSAHEQMASQAAVQTLWTCITGELGYANRVAAKRRRIVLIARDLQKRLGQALRDLAGARAESVALGDRLGSLAERMAAVETRLTPGTPPAAPPAAPYASETVEDCDCADCCELARNLAQGEAS